jgi:hypothetical protein
LGEKKNQNLASLSNCTEEGLPNAQINNDPQMNGVNNNETMNE